LNFEFRDYRCDLSGAVNQHYLEHAHHEFLKNQGVDYPELEKWGIKLVVIRIETDYLYPLRSGDRFFVGLSRTDFATAVWFLTGYLSSARS
jgi:acyl-CoA thioester hydrolase